MTTQPQPERPDLAAVRLAPACGCETTGHIIRGMCRTHYDRWVHKVPPEARGPSPRGSREFDDYVDKSGNCWLWTGPRNRQGYGYWSKGDDDRGLAHRLALLRVSAPPDPALFACHRCDNPSCVRPAHLYWGTAGDNSNDKIARRGVHNKGVYATHCKEGHAIEGDNLRISGAKKRRRCRECDNRRRRESMRRMRAARRG